MSGKSKGEKIKSTERVPNERIYAATASQFEYKAISILYCTKMH